MKRYLKKRAGFFVLTLALIITSDCIITGSALIEQMLVDAVLKLDAAGITRYIPIVIGYAAFSGCVYVVSNICQDLFSSKLKDDMRKSVFFGIMKRSRKDFSSVNYSDYISAITNDLTMIQRQYLGMLFMVVVFGGSLLLSACVMFYYQPIVAIAAIFCAALMTVLPMMLGKRLEKWKKEYSQKMAGLNTILTELFSGFQVISSFGIFGHAKAKFNQCSTELKNAEYKSEGMSAFSDGFAQLLSVTAQSTILVLAAYMVTQDRMTAGALVAFISLNQTFCSALSMVLRCVPMMRSVRPIIDRVNSLVDHAEDNEGSAKPSFDKKLEVKNLSFRYRENEPVLDGVSLTVRSGEKCALIGKSGSGKTTLIRLLMGELDGYAGQILYDGVALNEADREAVCKIASVIHQDVFLFDDTIRNNICLFDAFTDEEFDRAVRLSGVHKFMHQLAEGAEYRVGQRGEFLSGGQKQRIAIARALIRNTPFLILDEGTSALDAQTAEEIEGELMAIRDLTLLTITHNLRKPETYDHIFSMEKMDPLQAQDLSFGK